MRRHRESHPLAGEGQGDSYLFYANEIRAYSILMDRERVGMGPITQGSANLTELAERLRSVAEALRRLPACPAHFLE